jgi:hypothetical protein
VSSTWFSRLLPPERRKRLLLLALLLVPIALLTLLFRDVARTIVLLPVMYLAWVAGVLWRSIPQFLIWSLFVIVALRVAVGSLIVRRRKREEQGRPQDTTHWGRARIWAKWVELSNQGDYFRRRLARYLANLTLDTLAEHEHLPAEQVQAELEAGRLDVPPRIRAYVLAALNEPPPGRFAWFRQIIQGRPAPLQVSPEEILDLLEATNGARYGR